MARLHRYGILAGLALGATCAGLAPAAAFSLFGIRLWGSDEVEQVEVIDPLPYVATIEIGGSNDELHANVEAASALWTDRETPASGRAGLLSKARGDYRRLLAALYAEGHYGPYISIRIGGREAADLTLAAEIPPDVPVVIEVRPGPVFTFRQTAIVNGPPFENRRDPDAPDPLAAVGFAPGAVARAGAVGAASALAVERWRQLSRAKARETGRDIVADHADDRVDAVITIDPGARARYGPVSVAGNQRMDAAFIAYMADLEQGASFHPDDIRAAEDRLVRLGVFNSVRLEEAEEIGPDGSLPITIRVDERRRRTIGFGATYSTIDGLGLSAYWLHRNLFGRAERLRFDASVERLLSSIDRRYEVDPDDYNYNVGVTFTRPGIPDPDTSLVASAVASRLDFDTYRETSATGRIGLSRQFNPRLTGDVFAEISRARFEDDFGTRDFLTFTVAGSAQYDRRDDPLNATRGYFLAADARPSYDFEHENPALRGTLEGRIYHGFGAERRLVLAGRARVGSYIGPSVEESPPDQLFFTGGGGSIRGYEYRSIGIETTDAEGERVVSGGKGLLEASGEIRTRIGENFGAVAFVDGGVVTADASLGGADDLRIGVGLGVRYFTRIGPLRFDVATPLDPRPQDSDVAVYIGIGQAF